MGQSYRIRTELGVTKTINVQLDQEFEFLEILSLKLNQQDIYLRACSDYGVLVGRVTANNGLGLPNARVSVFIPIETIDESNPVISSIYPYKSPTDKNEDGFRYNLLPYEKSYSVHSATGTLPTRLDVLTGNTAFEIYDRYYKFTAKTNESGDYMIMGVPLGEQTIVMDLDLSDIGEFSLTPQDLIRMGRATEVQVAGNRFRSSNDLNSLPQIVNLSKVVEVSPLWGEPSICQIAINRVDFDLRDDANIDIQPTSVFMGSIFSTPDNFRLRPDVRVGPLTLRGSRPKDNFGNLCNLQPGTGQILSIRQTINLDVSGNPILEEYKLEQNGNVIDENGAWLVELPMNLDYLVTNEFGEKVYSYDPTIGIPTKSKYRFKIKWQQPSTFTDGVRRPYFLVPNIREYGWNSDSPSNNADPNISTSASQTQKNQLKSSYYFGLDWSGYTLGFNQTDTNTKLNEIINCEDTFYQFEYNRVYTVSQLIDQYKNGGRGRFVGIKEIGDSSCEGSVNKFPVNEGFRNFDFLFFIVSLILQIFQIISAPLIVIIHFVAFFLYLFKEFRALFDALFAFLVGYHIYSAIKNLRIAAAMRAQQAAIRNIASEFQNQASTLSSAAPGVGAAVAAASTPTANVAALAGYVANIYTQVADLAWNNSAAFRIVANQMGSASRQFTEKAIKDFATAAKYLIAGLLIRKMFQNLRNQQVQAISLPVITYPECQACECGSTNVSSGRQLSSSLSSLLTRFSDPYEYIDGLSQPGVLPSIFTTEGNEEIAQISFAEAIGGTVEDQNNPYFYKTTESVEYPILKNNQRTVVDYFAYSTYLPFGERVNIFNTRKKYFDGVNQISVSFNYTANTISHLDNTLTLFFQTPLETGALLTFVSPDLSTDKNFIFTGRTGGSNGIAGQALNPGPSIYNVKYCDPTNPSSNRDVNYRLSYGSVITGYTYPADLEYYQVLTSMTVSEAVSMFAGSPPESLPEIVNSDTVVKYNNRSYFTIPILNITFQTNWGTADSSNPISIKNIFNNFNEQYIVILQRGVDPYSPTYPNKYGLGKLFGSTNANAITITADTRLNIPIQKVNSPSTMSVQPFTVNGQSEIFFPSHFFRGGIPNSTISGEQWSAFTTPNVGYYSSMDSTRAPFGTNTGPVPPIAQGLVSQSSNAMFGTPQYAKYNSAEDISGAAFYYFEENPGGPNSVGNTRCNYHTKVFLPTFTATPMNISSNINNVMRTDRLPSSDVLDGGSWNLNPSLLQQNLGFAIYGIQGEVGDEFGYVDYSTGADIVTEDLEGQYSSTNLLDTLSVCSKIVSLRCYVGNGTGFTVNNNCIQKDAVEGGCYRFVRRPLLDIGKDIRNFNEWAYRFRFNYGLCRGVLSETFTNNWINGTLFAFPIQIDQYFDSNNRPQPPNFPSSLIYYDSTTRNFYFRSSPFWSGGTTTQFIGKYSDTNIPQYSINQRNLLFPTTIMNLGMKDFFYKEIIFEPSTNSYTMGFLNSTSYSDTSDILNLFVLSRITNASFLQQMLGARDQSINSLFTRNNPATLFPQPKNRVDADLVQMLSINSEVGVTPFSPEFYPFYSTNPNNAVVVLAQSNANSTIGIFFSSSTQDLQVKDFLTPGIIDFRFNPNISAVTYKYGIKSQRVPFYQWQLDNGVSNPSIFGSEKNNWATNLTDIVSSEYQSLDRRSLITPSYFVPSIPGFDVNQRGYIFNTGPNGLFSFNVFQGMKTKFMVGAPYQFYFGVVKGASALDKFKEKYLPNE